jgi:transposase-like protein
MKLPPNPHFCHPAASRVRWFKTFGHSFPGCLRLRRPRPGDKWHPVELLSLIRGVPHHLWRVVDQDDVLLQILVQPRWDGNAARRIFRWLLKSLQYVPLVLVKDKLRNCGVAQHTMLRKLEHRQSRHLNNRTENSHRPTRRRAAGFNGSNHLATPRKFPPSTHSSRVISIQDDTASQPRYMVWSGAQGNVLTQGQRRFKAVR